MAQIILDSNNNLIQGDFDNATLNNRTKLQTTTTNATTNVYVVPNGSSTSAGVSVANNSSLTNASKIVMATNGSTDTQIISGVNGSGTYLPLSFYTNNALAMQVATSGFVGIGTSSPSQNLHVQNSAGLSSYIGTAGNGNTLSTNGLLVGQDATGVSRIFQFGGNPITIWNNNVERMRISSGGDLFVGTTTGLDGGNGTTIKQESYFISSYRVTVVGGNYIQGFYSDVGGTATAKYAIYANGTAGAISDERYKKNIEPARNYLEDLSKINVIKYNWATDEDGTPKELGFSAQQVETIFPGLVDTVDNKDADGNVLSNQKILKRDVFLPMLLKAIQEQQTIINELKTRIEALESK